MKLKNGRRGRRRMRRSTTANGKGRPRESAVPC